MTVGPRENPTEGLERRLTLKTDPFRQLVPVRLDKESRMPLLAHIPTRAAPWPTPQESEKTALIAETP